VLKLDQAKIAVVGLGYVGLPLAGAFGKVMPTVGFDINPTRVDELRAGRDRTLEVESGALAEATQLSYSSASGDIAACNVFIVAVPTPVDRFNRPDLGPLEAACGLVGEALGAGDVVIFESTVYPGVTEDVCVPVPRRTAHQ